MAENNSHRASEMSMQAEDIDNPSDLIKDPKDKPTIDTNYEANNQN